MFKQGIEGGLSDAGFLYYDKRLTGGEGVTGLPTFFYFKYWAHFVQLFHSQYY